MKKYTLVLSVFIFVFMLFGFNFNTAKAATTPAPDCVITSTLRLGSRGDEVACLQAHLGLSTDGVFGKRTRDKVIDLQSRRRLTKDGVLGAISRAALEDDSSNTEQNPTSPTPTATTPVSTNTTTTPALPPVECLGGPGAVNNCPTPPPAPVCTNGFNPVTGFRCGCTSNSGFSTTTGLSCGPISTPTPTSITVLSPNGGETWTKGTTQNINWKDVNNISTHEVKLVSYPAPCTTPVGTVCPPQVQAVYTIANTQGSSFAWTIGKTWENASVPDGSYKIEVCQTGTTNCDSSDGVFNIVSGVTITPSITIISPNGGEIFTAGQQMTVRWQSSNIPAAEGLLIEMIQANSINDTIGSWIVLADPTPNDGIQTFNLDKNLVSGKYELSIKRYVGAGDVMSDGVFTINASVVTTPTITSVVPNQSGSNFFDLSISGTNFTGATALEFNGPNGFLSMPLSSTSVSSQGAIMTGGSGTFWEVGGTFSVVVVTPLGKSNSVNFALIPKATSAIPTITYVSPSTASVGDTVNVYGTNFAETYDAHGNKTQQSYYIYTYSSTTGELVKISTIFVSPTQIRFVVPSIIGSGVHSININTGDSVSNSVSLTVNPTTSTLPSCTITATPSTITAGQKSRLNWDCKNVNSVKLTPGDIYGYPSTYDVYPTTTTYYTLYYQGTSGSGDAGVNVTVSSVTPPTTTTPTIISLLPAGCTINTGYSSTTGTSCSVPRTSANDGDRVEVYGTNFTSLTTAGITSAAAGGTTNTTNTTIGMITNVTSPTLLSFWVPAGMGTGTRLIVVKNIDSSFSNSVPLNLNDTVTSTPITNTKIGKTICPYMMPPLGYHYEGIQPFPVCGGYLVKDTGEVMGAESFHFTQSLKNGSVGNEVIELQKLLNKAGYYNGTVDGKFGKGTRAAVINWQKSLNLKADGSFGPISRAAIENNLTPTPVPVGTPTSQSNSLQTYTNSQYGFSVNYPKDWKAPTEYSDPNLEWSISNNSNTDGFKMQIVPAGLSVDKNYTLNMFTGGTWFHSPNDVFTNISIDGVPAVRYDLILPQYGRGESSQPLGYTRTIQYGVSAPSGSFMTIYYDYNGKTYKTKEEAQAIDMSKSDQFLNWIKFSR